MEMYTGAEQRATETYMAPSSALNPHLSYVPQYEEVDYTGSEVAPEYIYDQGLYYPAANYYGYYSGFESPGEWDDQSSFFGVDGQDPLYSGVQTENSPYLYYTPSYGYTQSPYNPYNPYIPGAVIGLDVPYVGTQQYATNPLYQSPVSSASYIPVVVQPSTDVLNSTQRPSLLSTGAAGRHVNASVKYTPPVASINVAAKTQRGNPTPETSQASQSRAKAADGLPANVPSNKQALSQGTASHGSATHATQVRNSSGLVQAQPHFSHGRDSTIPNPLKIVGPSNDNFSQYGSNIRGWATVDKFRPRLQFHGDLNNSSGVTDALGEHNRGPRTSRSKSQWTPAVDGIDPTKSGSSCTQQSVVISADKYNRDDFPVSYPVAKFFVIKSYSEDDVHKSIKYNVWSSTSNGNRRLDSAYKDAQRISVGHARNCPMFLFFSVNASGQFCGVAEMTGPVEFDKDMDFWQQDKWTGSFPVKWHIIKDVPNTSFRHIILENNENKPVTNSRDTQEIPYFPGLNMLNIFKGTVVKTSILDDFMFYEERERIMQEEKARLLGKSYDASQFVRAVVPVNKIDAPIHHPLKSIDKQSTVIVKEPLKPNENSSTDANGELPKSDGKTPNGTPRSSTGKPPNGAVGHQPSEAVRRSTNVIIRSPPKQNGIADGNTPNHAVDQPTKADGKSSDSFVNQSLSKPKDTTTDVRLPKADKNSRKLKDLKSTANEPSTSEQNATQSKANQQVAKPKDITSTEVQLPKADRNLSQLKDPKSITGEPQTSEQKDTQNTSDQRPSKPKDSTRTNIQQPKANRSSKKLKDPKNIADDPSKLEQKDTSDCNLHSEANCKNSETSCDQPPKQHGKDRKSASAQHSKADRKQSKPKEQVTQKLDSIIMTNDKGDSKQKPTINAGGTNSTTKSGSHAVGSKEDGCSDSGAMSSEGSPMSVVTIGSVSIRVKGLVESSSGVITVGTIPIDPNILKHKQGASTSSYSNQK